MSLHETLEISVSADQTNKIDPSGESARAGDANTDLLLRTSLDDKGPPLWWRRLVGPRLAAGQRFTPESGPIDYVATIVGVGPTAR